VVSPAVYPMRMPKRSDPQPGRFRLVDCSTPEFKPEIVPQRALRELLVAQREFRKVGMHATLLGRNISAALERGAKLEAGKLKFDPEMKWVPE